jgi:hypothetical protein
LIIGSSRTRTLATPDGRSFVYTPRGYCFMDRQEP